MTKLLLAFALSLLPSCGASSRPDPAAAAPRASVSVFHPPVCSEAPPPAVGAAADAPTCDLPGSL